MSSHPEMGETGESDRRASVHGSVLMIVKSVEGLYLPALNDGGYEDRYCRLRLAGGTNW